MMIKDLFKKKLRIVKETAYFKRDFKRYYAKEMTDGTTEFWCHLTIAPSFTENKKSYYLGKWDDREIIQCDEFYELPWNVQKGALRLFELVKKFVI